MVRDPFFPLEGKHLLSGDDFWAPSSKQANLTPKEGRESVAASEAGPGMNRAKLGKQCHAVKGSETVVSLCHVDKESARVIRQVEGLAEKYCSWSCCLLLLVFFFF